MTRQRIVTFGSRLAILLILLLHCTLEAGAQVGNLASLTGLVRDPSGALVPEAHVVLIQIDTAVRQETTTTGGGRYQFARIPPGRYRIEVTKTGFQAASVPEVVVTVNEAGRADIELQVGPASDTVTVGASAGLVQTQSSENSTFVSGRDIRELPLNGRDFSRLIRLAPGIGGFAGLPTPSISGARNSYNTYAIDGLGNNDERSSDGLASSGGASSFDRTGAPNVISTEAIQEFRIVTSNADATFGRSSGGQISIVTKSGTSELHGSAYGYLRDDALDARNFFNSGPFFNDKGEAVAPPFNQQLYGGTLGGPIQRGRHFFFASYEGFRQRLQQTGSYVAPNTDLIGLMPRDLQRFYQTFFVDRGIVASTSAPGQFSALTAADRQAALTAGFPPHLFDGNAANGEAGTLLLSTASTRDIDQHAFLARTDHVLTERLRASARVGYARPTLTSATALPIDLQRDERRWTSAVGEVVAVLTPRQILEVRGGVLRPTFSQGPAGGVDRRFTDLGISEDLGIAVSATGSGLATAGLLGTSGFLDNQVIPQVQVQHTWTRGAWMLRTGADLSFQHIDIHNGAGRPTYTFQGFVGPRGLLGAAPGQETAIANSASASVFGANGGPTTALRTFETSRQELFAQADWQARPDLTVNLGLRYSYFGVYNEVNQAVGNLYATDGSGNIVADVSPFQFGRTANVIAPIGDDLPLYGRDRNNFEPRVGAAWNLGAKGRTVRAGIVRSVSRSPVPAGDERAGRTRQQSSVHDCEQRERGTVRVGRRAAGRVGDSDRHRHRSDDREPVDAPCHRRSRAAGRRTDQRRGHLCGVLCAAVVRRGGSERRQRAAADLAARSAVLGAAADRQHVELRLSCAAGGGEPPRVARRDGERHLHARGLQGRFVRRDVRGVPRLYERPRHDRARLCRGGVRRASAPRGLGLFGFPQPARAVGRLARGTAVWQRTPLGQRKRAAAERAGGWLEPVRDCPRAVGRTAESAAGSRCEQGRELGRSPGAAVRVARRLVRRRVQQDAVSRDRRGCGHASRRAR